MKKLRRALLRGAICGVAFTLAILCVYLIDRQGSYRDPGELLLVFGSIGFLTALVVGPMSAIELRLADERPSVLRDAVGVALSLALGFLGVALASIQFAYLEAILRGQGVASALDDASRQLRGLLRDPDLLRLCLAFATPFPCVTLARLRKLHPLIAIPGSVAIPVLAGLLLLGTTGSDTGILLALITGAALALDVGTRAADALAGLVERRLDPEAEVAHREGARENGERPHTRPPVDDPKPTPPHNS